MCWRARVEPSARLARAAAPAQGAVATAGLARIAARHAQLHLYYSLLPSISSALVCVSHVFVCALVVAFQCPVLQAFMRLSSRRNGGRALNSSAHVFVAASLEAVENVPASVLRPDVSSHAFAFALAVACQCLVLQMIMRLTNSRNPNRPSSSTHIVAVASRRRAARPLSMAPHGRSQSGVDFYPAANVSRKL